MSLSICWFIFMSRFLDIVIFLDQSPFAPPCVPILDEGTLLSRFFCCTLGWPPQTSYFHYTVAKIGPAKGLDAAPQGRPGKAIFFYSTCAFLQWWLSFIMRHCHYHTTLSSSIVFFWAVSLPMTNCLSSSGPEMVCPRPERMQEDLHWKVPSRAVGFQLPPLWVMECACGAQHVATGGWVLC